MNNNTTQRKDMNSTKVALHTCTLEDANPMPQCDTQKSQLDTSENASKHDESMITGGAKA
jgi:hypothetical protein